MQNKKFNKHVAGSIRYEVQTQEHAPQSTTSASTQQDADDDLARMLRQSKAEEEANMEKAMQAALEQSMVQDLESSMLEGGDGVVEDSGGDQQAEGPYCTDCGSTVGVTESAEWPGYWYCEMCTKAYIEGLEGATDAAEHEPIAWAHETCFSDTDSDEDRWCTSDSFRSLEGVEVDNWTGRAHFTGRGRYGRKCLVESYTAARIKLGYIDAEDDGDSGSDGMSMDSLDTALVERLMLQDMGEADNRKMLELMNQDMDLMNQEMDPFHDEPYGLGADGQPLFDAPQMGHTDGDQQDVSGEKKDRRRIALETDTITGVRLEELQMVSFLGAGSFGNVTLVRSTKDRSLTFALKQVSKHFMVEKRMVQDVKMERATLMTCRHPFIVHLHTTYQDASCIYFLMEVVEGPALHHLIQHPDKFAPNYPQPGLSARQARFYAACLISALQHMAMKGVAHRDMKPENVVVNIDGYVKIIDFGLATLIPKGKKARTVCGTRYYYAPEMIQKKGYTTKVDVWAFGVILYEMYTGWTPFMSKKYKVKKEQMNAEIVTCAENGTIPYERTAPDFPAK